MSERFWDRLLALALAACGSLSIAREEWAWAALLYFTALGLLIRGEL